MTEYKIFYLAVGIKYPNYNSIFNPCIENGEELEYYWQKELREQLDELSQKGWDLIQLSPELLNGDALSGYGIFKKNA